jgi:hypothetical protein
VETKRGGILEQLNKINQRNLPTTCSTQTPVASSNFNLK